MILTRLEVDGFRSLADLSIEPHRTLNLIAGPNGSGKSSVLEAIHCLSTGHSFRTRKPRDLVARGRDAFSVTARLQDDAGEREHRIGLSRQRDGELDMRLDYEPIDSVSKASRLLPVKALSPDSHALVQEGPDERRRFMDWGVFHVEHRFLDAWRRFRRSLSQRNQALRDQFPLSEIQSWDQQLAESGEAVDRYRRQYVDRLQEAVQLRIGRLRHPFPLALRYRGGWGDGSSLLEALVENVDQHRRLRTTGDGPHRAELVLSTDGVVARHVLSRGQQKVLVYLLHLAQLDLLAAEEREHAVVLCDDLLSELDGDYAADVIDQLLDVSAQIFVSGVSLESLASRDHAMFHVERGGRVSAG